MGSHIEHALSEAYMLCLRQGIIYKVITLVLTVAGVGTVAHITRLYITKVRSMHASSEEQRRINAELTQRLKNRVKRGGSAQSKEAHAERVVDRLEVVEVDEQHRDRLAGAAAPQQRVVDAIAEQRPVGEVGEQVVERLVRQLFLQLGQPGDRLFEVAVLQR